MRYTPHLTVAFAAAFVLGACAQADGPTRPGRNTAIGTGAGAAVGAVLGNVLSGGNETAGTLTGAAIGAALGGAAGYTFDNQQEAFEDALATERANNEIEIQRVREDMLRINLQNEVSFDYNSAQVNPAFRPTVTKLADVLTRFDNSNVTIVGHTDATGPDGYNQQLSERRAISVADELVTMGVNPGRITAIGRGESEPRATNDTAAGRQLNRRVEILVTPAA